MNRRQRPTMSKAAAAGPLLKQLLQQWGLEGKLREYAAWQVWDEVVGPQIAKRARPARVRDGVLEVRVDQAVWLQQLQLLKPKILARLNERLGGQVLQDIFWRRGKVDQNHLPSADPARIPLPPLPAGESDRIDEVVAPLSDPELRRRLRLILVRQAQVNLARDKG